jgi:DNA-binding NarL/FixJ family response regulator
LSSRVRILIACLDADFGAALASFAEAEGIEVLAVGDTISALSPLHERADVVVAIEPADFPPDRLVEAVGAVPVLMIGSAANATQMIASVEAGVLGYAGVESPFSDLVEAIRSVAAGVALIPPTMLGPLLRHVVDRRRLQRKKRERLQVLTEREHEVFELTARGLDRKQVSEKLFISAATARTHLQNVFRKLDIHSVAELVALAAESGLELSSEAGET